MDRICGIQYLRGVAAALIVIYHSLDELEMFSPLFEKLRFTPIGVDIFFVISGFVMLTSTSQGAHSSAVFFARRLLRVAPLYWLYTGILVVMVIVAPDVFRTTTVSLEHVLQSIFFIPHLNPSHIGKIWPVLIPGWTLNFEMFFYFVFAGLMVFKMHDSLGAVALIFGCLVLFGLVYPGENAVVRTYTSPLMMEFVLGVLIGHLYLAGLLKPHWLLALFGGCGMLVVLFWQQDFQGYARLIFWGVPAALIVSTVIAHEPLISSKRSRVLAAFGDASYSIYLSHLFVLGLLRIVWGHLPMMHNFLGRKPINVLGVLHST